LPFFKFYGNKLNEILSQLFGHQLVDMAEINVIVGRHREKQKIKQMPQYIKSIKFAETKEEIKAALKRYRDNWGGTLQVKLTAKEDLLRAEQERIVADYEKSPVNHKISTEF
jgi:hypothetical protein